MSNDVNNGVESEMGSEIKEGENTEDTFEEIEERKSVKVTPIINGIVIDHIEAGKGITVLDILGLPDLEHGSVVSAVLNVPTKSGTRKDIIKIEQKDLASQELDMISLITPNATINIIKNTRVVKKYKVSLPERVEGIIRCENPNCITNQKEPVEATFRVESRDPVVLKCNYCERKVLDLANHLVR